MIPMALTDVAAAIGAAYEPRVTSGTLANCATQVRRVATDSRDVQAGDLFFAIPGQRFDGPHFILEAASKGAVACVCRRDRLTASREVGEFLWSILETGAAADWRTLLKEKTGEDMSARAMLAYFQPLLEWLQAQNQGREHTLPEL